MNTVLLVAAAGSLVAQADIHIPSCDGTADECAQGWGAPVKSDEVEGVLEWPEHRLLQARCSAYSYTGSRTRTGTWPAFGTVAVDPNVIPLGSRLMIEAFPGVVFRAEDTGGAVRGAWLDIYMGSHAEAVQWGVRNCTVRVLR